MADTGLLNTLQHIFTLCLYIFSVSYTEIGDLCLYIQSGTVVSWNVCIYSAFIFLRVHKGDQMSLLRISQVICGPVFYLTLLHPHKPVLFLSSRPEDGF